MSPSVDQSSSFDGPIDESCLFCSIVQRKTEAEVVAETDTTVAFLDHRPLFFGHTLVVPRWHFVTLPDLPAELVAPVFTEAQRLADGVRRAFDAAGSFVAMNNIVSQSVPHLHVHLLGGRDMTWPPG